MGNCNCLLKEKDYSTEVYVNDLPNSTSNNVEHSISQNCDKRGVSIPGQSKVKQSLASKRENKNPGTIEEKSLSKYLGKTEINILILGATGVGKSSFLYKHIKGNKFEPFHIVTLASEKFSKKFPYNNTTYTLNFYDTAGNPSYKKQNYSSYEDIDFFIFFYDATSKKSLDFLLTSYIELKNYFFSYRDKIQNVIFIGNKCDQKDKIVKVEDVYGMIDNTDTLVFEISVKTNLNITKVFNTILDIFDKTSKVKESTQ